MNTCSEHPRIMLKEGKCWACGEIAGELQPKEKSIFHQFAFLIVVAIIVNLIFLINNLL